MRTNAFGVQIIIGFEGYSATPYQCSAKVWTIGYGSTRQPDGTPVTADTPAITREEAKRWLEADLRKFEGAVTRLVDVPLHENQFSALVSLVYNIGSGNFKASTLRSKLNRGDYFGASQEFYKWRRAGGKVLNGLVRRRAAEEALFLDV